MDWQGLLKWSLSYSDGTQASNFTPMDAERRQWLEEALASASINETQVLKTAAEALSQPETEERPTLKLDILGQLEDIIENLDTCKNFVKVGGIPHLVRAMIGSIHDEVRLICCQIFASGVQNNPLVQSAAIEAEAYTGLALRVCSETNLRLKALYMSCFSGLIRGENKAGREVFIANDGLQIIHQLLSQDNTEQIKKKCLLLLSDLFYYTKFEGDQRLIQAAETYGVIAILQGLLDHSDQEITEMASRALFNATMPLEELNK